MPIQKAAVDAFLKSLPEDRRAAITVVRKTVLKHLPKGYEESVAFGMLAYSVPLKIYPDTYNKNPLMYAAIASPKSYMAIHLPSAYGIPELRAKIEAGFRAAGKKLDMGKGCLRFKKLEDLELGVIGEVIAATPMKGYVAFAKAVHSPEARKERSKARTAAKGKPVKKKAPRK
jgi:Domain of unknown function (DU1801)